MTWTLGCICCFLLCKRPQKLCLRGSHSSWWKKKNTTTLLSDASHCKRAELSTVPLTLTVSICPFTDSVLGGVPLEAETLTVEREMWICNHITGNKETHYECAVAGWRIQQLLSRHWFNRQEVLEKVPLQLECHHFQPVLRYLPSQLPASPPSSL